MATDSQPKKSKLIMFDLDGTLTQSKSALDKEMAGLLCRLLAKKFVAVTSGASFHQFQEQLLDNLKCSPVLLKKLFILPTSGVAMYRYRNGAWHGVYQHELVSKDCVKIKAAFYEALQEVNYETPKKIYGKVLENRKSQVTFSALGQHAPLSAKKKWNTTADVRQKLRNALLKRLPEFEVRLGGLTSIDVTRKGLDKVHGIKHLFKILKLSKKDLLYVGDALYRGGNDYVVKKAGEPVFKVKNPSETKRFIRSLLQ